jgi:hypothetical protein
VKSVLTSQPIYHLTVFPTHKWLLKQIDRLRRSFLWKGEEPEKVSGGHCLINWSTVCTPKDLGGLGILDLERLARALRLRWYWFQWKNNDRPWTGLELPCDKTDKDLFHASTIIKVGKGNKTNFWYSRWLDGRSPRNLAPLLFRKSRRKNFTVEKALRDNFWIAQIYPLTTEEEIREYVDLWEGIQLIQCDPDVEDQITWRWTQTGEYTTKSAYHIQFQGRTKTRNIGTIWKAKTEPKCRFFAWILLHRKILTASNLAKRGWPHDPQCKLCNTEAETPTHLCKDCLFTKAIWSQLTIWYNLQNLPSCESTISVNGWWKKCRLKIDKHSRPSFDGLIIYFWWNIWKERNRRTFNHESKSVEEVAFLIKEDAQQYDIAMHKPVNTLSVS